MEYVTREKNYFTGFTMPVVITDSLQIPPAEDNYYAIIAWKEGIISATTDTGSCIFPAPGVLCITPGHSIHNAKFIQPQNTASGTADTSCDKVQSIDVRSLIFQPEGVNTTFTEFPDTFEYKVLISITSGFRYYSLSSGIAAKLWQLCTDININLNIEQGEFWPCLVRSFILEMLLLIERTSYITDASSAFVLPSTDEKTQQIFQYIHTSFHKKITLDSLASRFATNRTTLNKIFNQLCGTSAMSYLSNIRIEVATLLLRNTGLTVADISIRAGFSDESYFSRVFRQKTGQSPGEYRLSLPHPYGLMWTKAAL